MAWPSWPTDFGPPKRNEDNSGSLGKDLASGLAEEAFRAGAATIPGVGSAAAVIAPPVVQHFYRHGEKRAQAKFDESCDLMGKASLETRQAVDELYGQTSTV